MNTDYPILNINTDTEIPETLGTKEKFWINHAGRLCLLKFGRPGTGEDWAEKIACELCVLLDLPHAHYDLARFHDRSGVLSPSIVDADGRLILGNELINRVTRGEYGETRTYLQKEHTVSRVLAALAMFTRPHFRATWHQFIGYLMLDAWIGNTDRHHENWGLIISRDRAITLAPTFDHASSLGRELNDENRVRRMTSNDHRFTVESFAAKARSALYNDLSDAKPLSPIDAFKLAARVQRESGFDWLDRLAAIPDEATIEICSRVPKGVMSEPAKEFAAKLLDVNKRTLLSMQRKPK